MAEVSTGEVLHLRLFLEGVEVPIISANVSVNIGSPATANIEIVPTDRAMNLLARTTVHLFYLDSQEARYDPSLGETSKEAWNSELTRKYFRTTQCPAKDHYYKLLFCGEVFTLSYTKSGFGQRSITLQCLDFSNMWDTHYLYSLRYQAVDPGDGQGSAFVGDKMVFLGSNSEALNDIIHYPELVVSDMAATRRVANTPGIDNSHDLIGSLFSILEVLGGVHGKWFGLNAWATIQERRVRLIDQLMGDSGKTASKLYEQSVFEDWLKQKIGSRGAVMSFRDLIGMINGYVYYDVVPLPTGRYIHGWNTVPDWASVESAQSLSGLVGRSSAGTLSSLELGEAVAGISTGFSTESRAKLHPWFLDKVNLMERNLIEKYGWGGNSGRPAPRETALTRDDPNSKHGYGHAIDLSLEGLGTGYSSPSVYANAYDNHATASESLYGRVHYHYKFKGLDSPIRATDLADFQILVDFYKDLENAAKEVGLGSGVSWKRVSKWDPKAEVHYTEIQRSDGTVKGAEYAWAQYGVGWDPVHVESPFSLTQIKAGEVPALTISEYLPGAPTAAPTRSRGVTETSTPVSSSSQYGQTYPQEGGRSGGAYVEDSGGRSAGRQLPPVPDYEADPSGEAPAKKREKLVTQIFRPDVWFVPPPLCNVIFPEEYVSFSFNRQMMRETTRLELTTFNFLFEDAIVNQYYFAPQLEGIENLTEGGIGSAAKAVIYPHEKFSGIIPKMERISEVSFYSHLAKDGYSALEQSLPSSDPDEVQPTNDNAGSDWDKSLTSQPGNLIERYAAQVAAFNFLRHRYESRSGSLTGKFLPRIVAGFPMLVVNRPESDDGLEALHFLGMASGWNHTLSQGGGNTSVQLTHIRSHKAETDTDDLFSEGLKLSLEHGEGEEARTTIVVLRDNESAPLSPSDFFWAKYAQRKIREYGQLTGEEGTAARSALYLGDAGEGGPAPEAVVQPGTIIDVSTLGEHGPKGGKLLQVIIKDNAVLAAGINVYTDGYGTVETSVPAGDGLPVYVDRQVVSYSFTVKEFTLVEDFEAGAMLPLEEAIRPPWISNEYSNKRIGAEIYQKFLGCSSLVDIGVKPDENYATVSIEKAARELVSDYSNFAKSASADGYIHSMTRRVHATLPEVMESFHVEAFGDKTDLEGLDIVGEELTLPMGNDSKQELSSNEATRLDPRKERHERVMAYLSELLTSQGLRG